MMLEAFSQCVMAKERASQREDAVLAQALNEHLLEHGEHFPIAYHHRSTPPGLVGDSTRTPTQSWAWVR